jgi:hypothetical protein
MGFSSVDDHLLLFNYTTIPLKNNSKSSTWSRTWFIQIWSGRITNFFIMVIRFPNHLELITGGAYIFCKATSSKHRQLQPQTLIKKAYIRQEQLLSKTAKQIDACFQHKNMTFHFFFLRNNYTSNIQKWSKYCITSILNSWSHFQYRFLKLEQV